MFCTVRSVEAVEAVEASRPSAEEAVEPEVLREIELVWDFGEKEHLYKARRKRREWVCLNQVLESSNLFVFDTMMVAAHAFDVLDPVQTEAA